MQSKFEITKEKIDFLLNQVAKEYKRISNRAPIEIIIVGGCSIILNYGFREATIDIDAYFGISDNFRQAIHTVSEENNIPIDWLNDDFKKTDSFTHKLVQFSSYYKTFANIVEVRTVKGEYLIAMKLVSGRRINSDLSDVLGIILSERNNGNNIAFDDIDRAMKNLYGGWDKVSTIAKNNLISAFNNDDLMEKYNDIKTKEKFNRIAVIDSNKKNPIKCHNDIEKILDELDSKI